MDIETAEEMINSADVDSDGAEGISCNDCPAANECMDSYITCSAMSIRAARTVIAARDQRIAELEEYINDIEKKLEKSQADHVRKVKQFCVAVDERDEARRDAYIASNISKEYIEKYCYKIHSEPFEICNSEFVTVERIIEKYKDAK